MTSYAFLAVYTLDLATVAAFLVALRREAARAGVPLRVGRAAELLKHEARSLRKGVVGYLHLFIFAGIGVSVLYMAAYPALSALGYAALAPALLLDAGLAAALAWRAGRFVRGREVQARLGGHLRLGRRFVAASDRLQLALMAVIALTAASLTLSSLPGAPYFYAASVAFVARNAMMFLDVKPAVNMYMSYDLPMPELTLPFRLKDVLEGRADPAALTVGAERPSDFQGYEAHGFDSCVEIGACEDACPATAVGRRLSPRALVRKLSLQDKGSSVFDSITEEELWACTTCSACVYSCPVEVKHVPMIVDMRRKLVERGRVDKRKSMLLFNLGQYGNSLGNPNAGRHLWLNRAGMKTVGENPGFKYLLWVGCMGSFDERARKSITDFVEVLKAAGTLDEFAVLGDEEGCCGDPARRLGEEGKFQEMALANIEAFKRHGVKSIVLTCPHGCNTFENEYPRLDEWMKGVAVLHHAQYMEELMARGRLEAGRSQGRFVIHDPCYLSRYNGVVEPQRNVVGRIGELAEASRHGERTFCCGAGGANYWYEVNEERRMSHERLDQLGETGAETVVTLCPFCNAMLSDAAGGKALAVKDISEVVRGALT
ncbi:MAG: 4Fe-4S dicluster domain-containing protein [Nitrososphaerota archaeon]|nr:4Fe-4S dicluster domain-containing protein [Nitrososphaerota archaeon]